jgi:hypothetical protein
MTQGYINTVLMGLPSPGLFSSSTHNPQRVCVLRRTVVNDRISERLSAPHIFSDEL